LESSMKEEERNNQSEETEIEKIRDESEKTD
jgi:hypothetical protein